MSSSQSSISFLDQPKAVWATAFACVVGFMSIGLVDPILTSIAAGLNATPGQVSLLFTSYFFVTSVMMLITGFVSSRLGSRKTLLVGAALIVVFAALAGTSDSVTALVLYRGGWGLGNAFFVVTALSVIVAASRGGTTAAIFMYEAALGLGISTGPLLGAALGSASWRYPFFGTATLMAIGFIAILVALPEQPKPANKTSLSAPFRALAHPGLLTTAVSSVFYYYAFFTILAFTPFVLDMSASATGLIFFGWGLLLAVFSVFGAPRLQARFSAPAVMAGCLGLLAVLVLIMGFAPKSVIAAGIVLSGALMGVCNTVFTELALEVSDAPRPVASAGYNFLRWFAGVIAPFTAPLIAEHFGTAAAFIAAAIAAAIAPTILLVRRRTLGVYGYHHATAAPEAAPLGPVMVAVDGSEADAMVLARAIALAGRAGREVAVIHVRQLEVLDEDAAASESRDNAADILTRALDQVHNAGLTVQAHILEATPGQAARRVLDQAARLGISTLVVGTPHTGDISDVVHGSFAQAISLGMQGRSHPALVLEPTGPRT